MPLILPGNVASATASTGYTVDNSCRFNKADTPSMTKDNGTPSSETTGTISFWTKRCILSVGDEFVLDGRIDANNRFKFAFNSSDIMEFWNSNGGSDDLNLNSNRKFRDVSAWYHFVIRIDTTQSTAADRVRVYVNGVNEADVGGYSTETYPDEDSTDTVFFENSAKQTVGAYYNGSAFTYPYDGYLAEVVYCDGQSLAPTEFGEFDEDSPTIWKPKDVSGLTFGNNGFYLDFEDSANLGNDANGGTDLTETNLAATDQATDTPTNNFATFNSIYTPDASNLSTFSEGNLRVVSNSTSVVNHGTATIGPSSGKWYAEFKLIAEITGESACGVIYDIGTGPTLYGTPAWSVCSNGDTKYAGSNTGTNNWSGTYTTDDIISVALDLDNNKIYFAKNGSWVDGSGNWDESSLSAYRDLVANKDYFIAVGDKSNDKSSTWDANFGSPPYTISSGNADGDGYGNFEYAVPSGFYALCTKNLAEYG